MTRFTIVALATAIVFALSAGVISAGDDDPAEVSRRGLLSWLRCGPEGFAEWETNEFGARVKTTCVIDPAPEDDTEEADRLTFLDISDRARADTYRVRVLGLIPECGAPECIPEHLTRRDIGLSGTEPLTEGELKGWAERVIAAWIAEDRAALERQRAEEWAALLAANPPPPLRPTPAPPPPPTPTPAPLPVQLRPGEVNHGTAGTAGWSIGAGGWYEWKPDGRCYFHSYTSQDTPPSRCN